MTATLSDYRLLARAVLAEGLDPIRLAPPLDPARAVYFNEIALRKSHEDSIQTPPPSPVHGGLPTPGGRRELRAEGKSGNGIPSPAMGGEDVEQETERLGPAVHARSPSELTTKLLKLVRLLEFERELRGDP